MQPLIVSIVLAGAGILGGLGGFFLKAWLDRRALYQDRIFDIHNEMLEAIGKIASAKMEYFDEKSAQHAYAIAKMKYSAVATDQAVQKLGELNFYLSNPKSRSDVDMDAQVAGFMLIARKEIHNRTTLTEDEILRCSPFSVNS